MLRIIIGTAGSGKTSRVIDEIASAVSRQEYGQLLLVPEQYTHEAEREMCRACGDSLSLYAEVISFSRLANRIEAEFPMSDTPYLDKGGRLLAMALALDMVRPRLNLYGATRRLAELCKLLLTAVDELKAACITPDELLRAASLVDNSGLCNKLNDLALILDAYDLSAAQSGLDPMTRLDRLRENLSHCTLNFNRIYIDGFMDFTVQEIRIILKLMERVRDITVCLTCDGLNGGLDIFNASRKTALKLKAEAERLNLDCEIVYSEQNSPDTAMGFLERNLFAADSPRFEGSGCVSLFRADSVSAECELAAARAISLVRDTGCRFRDIAVAARNFDSYAPVIENIFGYYGVPLYLSRKSSLMEMSAPALISSVIEIISGGWEYDAVFSYLKTGLAPIAPEDRDILENYVILWSIRGAKIWTRDEPWTLHPGGYGVEADEASDALLRRIDELRRYVAQPISSLASRGKSSDTARDHAISLWQFLDEIALAETLSSRSEYLVSQGELTLSAEYVQVWEIIITALEQCAAILGEMKISQAEFFAQYKLMLSQYEIGTIPVSLDRVSAGDFDRMRRRSISHLIVLGAADGRLPQVSEFSGVFSDSERDTLSELGLGIASGAFDSLSREMNLIYNCLTLPSDTLTISYSTGSDSAAPSFLVDRLSVLFDETVRPVDLWDLRTNAINPATELAARLNALNDPLGAAVESRLNENNTAGLSKMPDMPRTRRTLSGESVRMLYGEHPHLTASRVELFSSCRLRYFLSCGLRASPRTAAGFNPPEMGVFTHYVLEGAVREITGESGFLDTTPEHTLRLADKYAERYISDVLSGFKDKSERFEYLFRRNMISVRQVVSDMVSELSRSEFVPLDFELRFGGKGELPPIVFNVNGKKISIDGIVDRVDGWEHNGKLYLRVVDYKTGRKPFSLSDIRYGLGMQTLMYLFALPKNAGDIYYGLELVPAGALHIPARNDLVKADRNLNDEEIEVLRIKNLRRSGLILDDPDVINAMEREGSTVFLPVKQNKDGEFKGDLASPEHFKTLERYIQKQLHITAKELIHGSVDTNPYHRNQNDDACKYCEFAGACHFDESRDSKRFLSKLRPEEFWTLISEDNESF